MVRHAATESLDRLRIVCHGRACSFQSSIAVEPDRSDSVCFVRNDRYRCESCLLSTSHDYPLFHLRTIGLLLGVIVSHHQAGLCPPSHLLSCHRRRCHHGSMPSCCHVIFCSCMCRLCELAFALATQRWSAGGASASACVIIDQASASGAVNATRGSAPDAVLRGSTLNETDTATDGAFATNASGKRKSTSPSTTTVGRRHKRRSDGRCRRNRSRPDGIFTLSALS